MCPIWLPIFLYFLDEPGLGVTGIDPGMALTPLPCSIWKRLDSNPQPFDCEPSSLTTTPSSHSSKSNLCINMNWGLVISIRTVNETPSLQFVISMIRYKYRTRYKYFSTYNEYGLIRHVTYSL